MKRFFGKRLGGLKLAMLLTVCFAINTASAQKGTLKFALLKYSGGGDWYNDVNSLRNLAKYCNQTIGTSIDPEHAVVESGSADIFNYPIVYATGHGNMVFTDQEAA